MATGKAHYGTTEIKDFFLDIYKPKTVNDLVATGTETKQHIVTPAQAHRPDKLSFDLYGNSKYWWTIAMLNRNALTDPIRDLKAGLVLEVLTSTSGV